MTLCLDSFGIAFWFLFEIETKPMGCCLAIKMFLFVVQKRGILLYKQKNIRDC